uniref:Cation-transporting P-type ATPase C-terminal domain-containing protein n=1 Tax=Quercus lobata TaxID=97700 RepID=A0A7N2LT81_QUELO
MQVQRSLPGEPLERASYEASKSSHSEILTSSGLDLESQQTVLLTPRNPPRERWRRAVFLSLHERNLIHRADDRGSLAFLRSLSSCTSYYSAFTSFDDDTREADIVEILTESPESVNLDGENDNCIRDAEVRLQQANIAKMVKEKDLDSIHKFGGIQGIAEALGTDLKMGISLANVQDVRSRGITCTLSTTHTSALGFLQFLPKSCNNYTILLLFACAVLSRGFGVKEEGLRTGWYEGVIIILAIIILVVIDSLRNQGGRLHKVIIGDVLIGDLVRLERDHIFPADGLFTGESLKLDDGLDSTINEENPFLFYGAKVIDGKGCMLVASVGMNTRLGDLMKQVTPVPEKTPLPAQIDKEDIKSSLPDLKEKPKAIKEIMDAIDKIVMKPNGKISTLTTSLATLLVGVMEGIPFVITLAISYWNKKMMSEDSEQASAKEPFACLTMSSVTQCGLLPCSYAMVLEGEEFRKFSNEERMNKVDQIILIGSSIPSDQLTLVQCLKKKGHIVAMVGVKTNAIPALKEADVGITTRICSTEMARASSGIIIGDENLSFLVTILRFGRCTFENIQKYIQLELTMNIAGLLITTITTMFCGYSPITSIQLLWANFVVSLLGGIGLLTEPPTEELMEKLPLKQTKPLITKAMWRNIVSQALYQVTISVAFQFKGQTIPGISNKVSKTIIFNSFVLCQVFNQVNARELEKKNVFKSIHRNPLPWVSVGVILILQVAFIEIAHIIVGNARLNWMQWFSCLLAGMVSWASDWVTKSTAELWNCLTRLLGSHLRTINIPQTRGWASRVTRGYKPPDAAHVPSMLEGEQSCKLEHYRTKQDNWPYGYLATGSRDLVKPRGQAASHPCFVKPDISHSSPTPV